MLLWIAAICIPLPLIVLTLKPELMDSSTNRATCEDPLPVPASTASTSDLGSAPKNRLSLYEYLFRTRNAALQAVLAAILYGGFGVYFIQGYQYLPENTYHRPVSVVTVAFSIVAFVFATMSEPKWIISPIHKNHCPPEIKSATPETKFGPEIRQAVNERFKETWFDHIGVYPYDNTIFFAHQWCKECEQPRPARSQHCSLCGHCVARADHHCWWLNTHVGEGNYHIFFGMLIVMGWLVTYGTFMLYTIMQAISETYKLDDIVSKYLAENGYNSWGLGVIWFQVYKHQFLCRNHPLLWLLFALISTLSVPVLLFLGYHTRLVLFNITSHEDSKRNYLSAWLVKTFLGDQFDDKLKQLDRDMISFATNEERDEFWEREENGMLRELFGGAKQTDQNKQQTDQNDQKNDQKNDKKSRTQPSSSDDVVGCVPGLPHTNTQVTKDDHIEPVTGCFGPSNCDDCSESSKSTKIGPKTDLSTLKKLIQNRPVLRSPFPFIFNASTQGEYEMTQDEAYIREMVQNQNRPPGYCGWYEPDTSPHIVPKSHALSTDDSNLDGVTESTIPPADDNANVVSSKFSKKSPLPTTLTREYLTFALEHNIYDSGSVLANAKDAFGLVDKKKTPKGQFTEFDLDLLIQLKCDWEKEQQPDTCTLREQTHVVKKEPDAKKND